jgi:hypothetical protein
MPCEPSCPCLHLFSDEFHSRLGLVWIPSCLPQSTRVGMDWGRTVELKLIYTPIHLNACGLRRIREYPNNALCGSTKQTYCLPVNLYSTTHRFHKITAVYRK